MNIVAIATAPGTGGIAVIRLSGPDAFTITDRIFRARNRNKTVSTAEAYTMLFGYIIKQTERQENKNNINPVLLSSCLENNNNTVTSEATQNSSPKLGEVPKAEGYVIRHYEQERKQFFDKKRRKK